MAPALFCLKHTMLVCIYLVAFLIFLYWNWIFFLNQTNRLLNNVFDDYSHWHYFVFWHSFICVFGHYVSFIFWAWTFVFCNCIWLVVFRIFRKCTSCPVGKGGGAMYSQQPRNALEQLGGAVLGKWLHKFIGWFLFGYPHLISAVKGTKGQIIIHVHIPPHRHGKISQRVPELSVPVVCQCFGFACEFCPRLVI